MNGSATRGNGSSDPESNGSDPESNGSTSTESNAETPETMQWIAGRDRALEMDPDPCYARAA